MTADHSRMGSAMVLSLHCFSPPGVRSSLFVKVYECFYALVVSCLDPCGEGAASVINDTVVKVHYGTRALSTCPPPSKETPEMDDNGICEDDLSVRTVKGRLFPRLLLHILPGNSF